MTPASLDAPTHTPDSTWLSQRERGTVWFIRALAFWAIAFGRGPARAFLRVLAFYYAVFDRKARQTSRQWFTQVQGTSPGFFQIYRHILRFTHVALDRVFLLKGRTAYFNFTRTGNHYLEALATSHRGAILLGAHLGSFEAMRAAGQKEQLPLYMVGQFRNAKMISAVLEKLNPEMANRVIHVGDDPFKLALTLRHHIEKGALIAILGDRVGPNDKYVDVEFFGRKAAFPTGPFFLAHVLKCPIYLAFGLYHEPNHYHFYCEPFIEYVELPKDVEGSRQVAMQECAQAFALRLEAYCKMAPDNWFNFYDFWQVFPK